MPTHIEEGAQDRIAPAHDNNAFLPDRDHLIGAGASERFGPPNTDPHGREDALQLQRVYRWVIVVAARECGGEWGLRTHLSGHGCHLARSASGQMNDV